MSRRAKFIATAATLVCLITVPVTVAAYDTGTDGSRSGSARRSAHLHKAAARQARSSRRRSVTPTRPVYVDLGPPLTPVPRSYLGLSIEYWGLPLFEHHLNALGRVLRSLRARGDGPLILRVGGDSADRSLWDPGARRVPQWAFRLSSRWLHLTNLMLASAPVRLILDLNLVTASPVRSVAWALAARSQLRHGSIAAFEIGNEPDIYDRPYWLATIARLGSGTPVLPTAISPRSYVSDFGAYARALSRAAPGIPLIGPAVANPHRSIGWIRQLAAHARRWLGALSAHRYPYSACVGRASPASPTIPRLLSQRASAGIAQAVGPAALIAHRAGLPFRITELNSVTCGGRAGISDTFATALWAPDALFELMRAGVDGVNIHVRADTVNAAMVPDRHGLRQRPLLYGLILFARALDAGSQLLSLKLAPAPAGSGLKAWAVRAAGGETRVVLINKTSRPVGVVLRIPGHHSASVQRLLAPSARSTSGETLNGQWLDRAEKWRGRAAHEHLAREPQGYRLRLPALSAALVVAGDACHQCSSF